MTARTAHKSKIKARRQAGACCPPNCSCHSAHSIFSSACYIVRLILHSAASLNHSQRAVVVVNSSHQAQLVRVEGGVLAAEEDLQRGGAACQASELCAKLDGELCDMLPAPTPCTHAIWTVCTGITLQDRQFLQAGSICSLQESRHKHLLGKLSLHVQHTPVTYLVVALSPAATLDVYCCDA